MSEMVRDPHAEFARTALRRAEALIHEINDSERRASQERYVAALQMTWAPLLDTDVAQHDEGRAR